MFLTAVDVPPVGMTTPVGAQTTAQLAIGAVVAAMVLGALWRWYRTGQPTGVLLLVGGLGCSMNEALVDQLGHCWFPPDGAIAYSAFGYAVPWWVVTAYVGFFGGLTWLTAELLATGPTRRRMWAAIGGVWVVNLILEMPILASGLYQYYGYQPLEVGGFPLNWLVINSLGSLFAAVLVARLPWWFTGARRLLLVLVPYVTYFASWVAHMPLFLAHNADVSDPARLFAAVLCILLGLVAMDALVRTGVAPTVGHRPAVPADDPQRASVR
ncbi:hypothetical protein GCM10023321_23160 [Pseudonocardia eucalypti]|uniref:Carotenoid biosynthesis protein n=1 Tax=Pseudonocardia eucalypti TaxID=648755 RepID=A0ABP9PWC5_9PSEU|nr:hypothetical protein [Pseudonocardia eucalypti]